MAATWKSIKQLREAAGISQGELAKALGCSQAWLSAREQGAALSQEQARRAVAAIGVIRDRKARTADRLTAQLKERLGSGAEVGA